MKKTNKPTNSHLLHPNPPPLCFIEGEYAAIPYGNQLMILHNGKQIKLCRNQQSARNFISKHNKKPK